MTARCSYREAALSWADITTTMLTGTAAQDQHSLGISGAGLLMLWALFLAFNGHM